MDRAPVIGKYILFRLERVLLDNSVFRKDKKNRTKKSGFQGDLNKLKGRFKHLLDVRTLTFSMVRRNMLN